MNSSDLAYGVFYRPSAAENVPSVAQIQETCLASGISFVRFQWCDLINSVRFRALPTAYFIKLLKTNRPGMCLTANTLGMIGCGSADGFPLTGEWLYALDLCSFRLCTYAPGHASVMGWFQLKTPAPGKALEYELCPRTLLKRVLDEAHAQFGLTFLAGIESEFILLKSTSPLVTVNDADWCCSRKLPTGSIEAIALEEMAHALIDAGIELQMYHAESAPGQCDGILIP